MAGADLRSLIEDHALDTVPAENRENWLQLSWNTVGLVTTLVILFFGALVSFVAGIRIALLAGLCSFALGAAVGWALARVTFDTGYSNTRITREHGLGARGSALASLIFSGLIIGFLAVENALLYRGFLFFFGLEDTLAHRILIYGLMTVTWVLLTTFGFGLVTRFSSLMVSAFLVVLGWVLWKVVAGSNLAAAELFAFGTQLPPAALDSMGIEGEFDKFVFAVNILLGPSMAIALNTADFGRYGKSTLHIGLAATAGVFFQSLLVMLVGAILMHAGAGALVEHYIATGMTPEAAHARVLQNPDSIAATFMVFGGPIGFVLMLIAQGKAQVLNSYSASLSLANLGDASAGWRPGRLTFVILANLIALIMLYGHLLEYVESWIRLFGVLLSSLSMLIIVDYYWVAPRLPASARTDPVNWAGVISVLAAITLAHGVLRPVQPVEVLTAAAAIAIVYPLLRLQLLRPGVPRVFMESR